MSTHRFTGIALGVARVHRVAIMRTVALAIAGLLLAGCGSSPAGTHHASSVRAPEGDLYQPPSPLPPGKPGDLIWAEPIDLRVSLPAAVWRILYHSTDRLGADVAVSGFVLVPKAKAPPGGRPVQAWAHGTAGLGDQCAPSKRPQDNFPPPYDYKTVVAGGVVVATDYQGLGTPGVPPSAGVTEGHDVLDSVRAVAGLPGVGKIGDVVLAGHSQGGAAVLFAAQLAPTYAPELHIRGVVALAPGGELPTLVEAQQHSPGLGGVLSGAIALTSTYPKMDLKHDLTPKAFAELSQIEDECLDATVGRWAGQPADAVFTRDPTKIPAVRRILVENSPGGVKPQVPLLILQGTIDEQIPVTISATISAKYCQLGATVTHHLYPGINHDGLLDAATEEVSAWMSDRLHGKPAPSTCG